MSQLHLLLLFLESIYSAQNIVYITNMTNDYINTIMLLLYPKP